jgi:hypothetical protein
MGVHCKVCQHEHRAEIELGLGRRIGLKTLAAKFGMSKASLSRHAKNHLSPALKATMRATGRPTEIDLDQLRKSESEGLLGSAVALRARLYRQLDAAEETGDLRAAASIDGRILDSLGFVAKLLGEISTHNQTTITQLTISPEYLNLRAALIRALMPFPAARKAVSEVIRAIEGVSPVITGSPRTALIEQEPP